MKQQTSIATLYGLTIKEFRETSNVSQGELAKSIGLTGGALSKIEKGETVLTVEHLHLIANELQTEAADIIARCAEAKAALVKEGWTILDKKIPKTSSEVDLLLEGHLWISRTRRGSISPLTSITGASAGLAAMAILSPLSAMIGVGALCIGKAIKDSAALEHKSENSIFDLAIQGVKEMEILNSNNLNNK